MVGAVGFEPTTPWSQTRCTTRLCYAPISTLKVGVNDGIRTRDNWNHNPGLYQLSYIHHYIWFLISSDQMARLTGFEPVTIRLEGGCSIQLSYKRVTDVNIICLEELVGAVGFEPTTPWSQTRCTTRLCYAPIHLSFCIELSFGTVCILGVTPKDVNTYI